MTAGRRAARLAAVGAVAGLFALASTATPAKAHDRVDAHGTIKVDPAGDVAAVPTVSGIFKSTEVLGLKTENISSVSLTLAPTGPTGGEPVTADGCSFATEGECGTGSVAYSWTPPSPSFNGPYEARATAEHCTVVCVTPSTAQVTPAAFRLGIAPRPPADVQVTGGPERSASVSWAKNPEPDMLFYALFRKLPGGADFTRIGGDIKQPASGRVAFSDTGTGEGGVIAYKVVAVRKGVSGDEKTTKTSSPSTERSVTIEAPVPTTLPVAPGQLPGASQPPQAVPAGAGVSISGFLGSQPAAKPAPGPRYLDLPDTGFGGTLPFDTPPAEDELEEGELEAAPPALSSDEDTSLVEEVSLTRPLVPIAAGAILLVLAAHMRLLSRKLKENPAPAGTSAAGATSASLGKKRRKAARAVGDGALASSTAYVATSPQPYESYEPDQPQDSYDVFEPDDSAEAGFRAEMLDGDGDVDGGAGADIAGYDPASDWVEFEPPSILDSSAGGGSLLAPESIGSYTEAAAPYYEGVPSYEPTPPSDELANETAERSRRSTAVWRGPDFGEHSFDNDLFDFEAAEASDASEASVEFDEEVDPAENDLVSSDSGTTSPEDVTGGSGDGSSSTVPEPESDDAWEEEMIWEVVSPSR